MSIQRSINSMIATTGALTALSARNENRMSKAKAAAEKAVKAKRAQKRQIKKHVSEMQGKDRVWQRITQDT